MRKYIYSFCILLGIGAVITPADATSRASDYVSANTYNNMYPYMNNRMRTNLNPGINTGAAPAQVTTMTRTIKPAGTTERRVVPRRATNTATTIARSGVASAAPVATSQSRGISPTTSTATRTTPRRVVARAGRGDASSVIRTAYQNANPTGDATPISSTRCLADYTECMNGYCARENTKYNKCYCSAKLSQIDARYQPAIDSLIKQILTIRNTNHWTQAEMDEYWMDTIGKYTGDNSWSKLDDALNIDWADTTSRVRGQQAFATGHEYCVQHLRGCAYMASNLRDIYLSEITRDCAAYESSLQRLQNVAESVVESYKK